jgi:hypothetical protein
MRHLRRSLRAPSHNIGIALALLRKLDDELRKHHCQRISTIGQPELAEGELERGRQIFKVFP